MSHEQPQVPQTEGENKPTFKSVAAIVPQMGLLPDKRRVRLPNAHHMAEQLTSGSYDLPHASSLEPIEDIVYIRTADEILRINPDGSIERLDMQDMTRSRVPMGYAPIGRIELNKPLEIQITDEGGRELTKMWHPYETTKSPVLEVLLRTRKPVSDPYLSTTDTALLFGEAPVGK